MMEKITDEIRKIVNGQITNFECCSRLFHKNIVYHVFTENDEYAIKFFYEGTDKNDRLKRELLIYNYFKETKIINVSEIINIGNTSHGKAIVINWIKGQSIKSKLKVDGLNSCYNNIINMLLDLENIWSINDKKFKNKLPIDKLGISNRFDIHENVILNTMIKNKPSVNFIEIIDIYKYLKNKITPEFNYVINSDVSSHEYLITDKKCYWIDFEKVKLGNPNNDLARAFQSLTNSIYKNTEEFNQIFSIFENNRYYQKDIFLYYLIEKLFSTIYTAKDQVDDEEINFYITFIKQNFYKLNCKDFIIKKRTYLK